MKRKSLRIFIITIICLMMVMLYSCDALLDKLANPEADAAAELLIKHILTNDLSVVTDNIHPSILNSVNDDMFVDVRNRIDGDFVSMKAVSRNINKQSVNGVTTATYSSTYLLKTTEDKEYNINTIWLVNNQGKGFTEFSLMAPIASRNTAANIALLIFSILMIMFALASFIVCLNTKMDNKGLYAALIVILFCGFTSVNGGDGSHSKINFLFSYISQYLSIDNNVFFSINFPIGAIAFWSNRKKMMKKYSERQNSMIELMRPKENIEAIDNATKNVSEDETILAQEVESINE